MKTIFVLLSLLLGVPQAWAQTAPLPYLSSAKIEAAHVMCNGPCLLYRAFITMNGAAGFWMIFDASSIPADGTLTKPPMLCLQEGATGTGTFTTNAGLGLQFTNGLTFVLSTGADCLHKIGSATAFFSAQVQQ